MATLLDVPNGTSIEPQPAGWSGKLLQDRVAIVSGGSRGIGRAIVQRLTEAGAQVVLNYLQADSAAEEVLEFVRSTGGQAVAVRGDIASKETSLKLVQEAVRTFGKLDIVVANAGIWEGAPIQDLDEQLWDRVLDANLKGTWAICHAAVPELKRRGSGVITIISSTAGQRGEAGYSNYAASKGGQISFAKSLASELAPQIRVNCVAPGWVDTELNSPEFERSGRYDEIARSIPLQRVATPDDIAHPVVFLSSDWARHISGEVLNVNGGSVLCG
jgi:3-oxoacyl-[acyl-carrier protein] reductase